MRLEGKTAIVTGGGGEIGRAIALGLAREGARVAIADINLAAAAQTAREIEAGGGQALALSCDVSDAGQVERMVSEVVGHFGGVDILINGAGIQFRAPVAEASEEHWDQTMAVNLKGPFLCSRAVLRHMMPRRTGTILNLASGLGLLGLATASAYAASKAGLINFTRSLAQEVVSHNITVNAVAPGRTDTPLFRPHQDVAEVEKLRREGLIAQPEDVVETVLFLCGPESRFLTGVLINREFPIPGRAP